LTRLLIIVSMVFVLETGVITGIAQIGGQIGFVGSFAYGNNTSPTNLYSAPANWSLATDSDSGSNLLISMTTGPQGGTLPGPSFGSEIFSWSASSTNSPPGACPITANVSAGQRIVVLAIEDGVEYQISNLTDSQGNSYSRMVYYNNSTYSTSSQNIWSAYVKNPLKAGADTITITWSPNVTVSRAWAISIVTLNNTRQTGQPDSTAQNNAYGYTNSVSIPGTTVAANTVSVGLLVANDFVWTIGNGTIYDALTQNIHYDFFYHVNTSAGFYNPGGTGALHNTYSGSWAAFK